MLQPVSQSCVDARVIPALWLSRTVLRRTLPCERGLAGVFISLGWMARSGIVGLVGTVEHFKRGFTIFRSHQQCMRVFSTPGFIVFS